MDNIEWRLECLKLAATLAKDPDEIRKIAQGFLDFVAASVIDEEIRHRGRVNLGLQRPTGNPHIGASYG